MQFPECHLSPPIPCSHPACNAEATAESISTEWPLILRIDPIRHSDNMRDEPLVTDLLCPLTLNLGFDVEYILIVRVIFIPPVEGGVGHYLTKTKLEDSTYLYNDLRHNGLLTELEPLHLLEDHDPATSFVIYLRTSKASTTSRTVGEAKFDYAKIPSPPPADPIPVSDDSDDEIGQMLIDSITTPTKETPILPRLSSSPRSDKFFTPEQSPAPPVPYDTPNALADTSDETKSATPSPVFCEPCGANLPEGDDDPDEIGTIRSPFYMRPDDPGHQNPTLTSIFDTAIPQVAGILADWNNLHPAVASFNEYFAGKKKHLRSREAPNWMDTLGLVSTPELEAVLTGPFISLMDHPALLNLTEEECQTRVMGVGSVLLQFLAVQHELGESLNLNSDLVEDLKDESVVACLPDGDKALNAMFSAIPSTSTRSGVLV
ncbi:hypothetical protein DFH09DRAFT_1300125 [Mycena vulgaris]|nr:hypothetical protein DFH09DRAFT_1300125 [Mycena vulgaris]